MKKLGWWLLFLFSTFALSKVLEASRDAHFGLLACWSLCLAAGLTLLAYDAYAKAKLEGKLARKIAFFEWLGRHQNV